jgi:hypothetical protein
MNFCGNTACAGCFTPIHREASPRAFATRSYRPGGRAGDEVYGRRTGCVCAPATPSSSSAATATLANSPSATATPPLPSPWAPSSTGLRLPPRPGPGHLLELLDALDSDQPGRPAAGRIDWCAAVRPRSPACSSRDQRVIDDHPSLPAARLRLPGAPAPGGRDAAANQRWQRIAAPARIRPHRG